MVRDLNPGYFGFVMATAIVSSALEGVGLQRLSGALLWISLIAFPVLFAAYVWRFVRYRAEFLADAMEPRTAFAFFTFVAAADVLGSRLAGQDATGATAGLLILATLAWIMLSYVMPVRLLTHHGARSALAGVNGTWFLWIVGTQSIAIAAASLTGVAALAPVAVSFWSVGVLLYVLVAGLVLAALLQYTVEEAGLTPAYWVFMGATAISVRTGTQLLSFPVTPLLASVRPVVSGLSVALWAFGTWLVPLLLSLDIWRYVMHHASLRYDPAAWSMVFPLGMYAVASRALGLTLHVPWLVLVGVVATWVAVGVWAVIFTAMLASFVGLPRR